METLEITKKEKSLLLTVIQLLMHLVHLGRPALGEEADFEIHVGSSK